MHSNVTGSGESLNLRIQGSGDSSTRVRNILPTNSVISTSVPVHWITQLGLGSHPTGSSTPEATTATLSFFRSNKLVYTTASIRPIGPCQPTLALAGTIFSKLVNTYLTVPGGLYDIYGRLYAGMGGTYGPVQIASSI